MTTVDVEQLSCQELVELVTDYLEDALSRADRERFEAHVGRCGGCGIYLVQMRRTIELVGRLSPGDLSSEAEEDLLRAFRDWRG